MIQDDTADRFTIEETEAPSKNSDDSSNESENDSVFGDLEEDEQAPKKVYSLYDEGD